MTTDRINSHWPGPAFTPSRVPNASGFWNYSDWVQDEGENTVIYRNVFDGNLTNNPDLSKCLVNWSN